MQASASVMELPLPVLDPPVNRVLEVIEGERDQYRPGSEIDFARLYHTEALSLTRTVYGILGNRAAAEDCVQEAFVRAYRKWSTWQPDAPAKFWVQRIAINLALSQRRRDKVAHVKNQLLARPEAADDSEGGSELTACLQQLPVKQSTAILLRFNHGYNNREIAATLGISERAVGLRLESGLSRLKKLLADAKTIA